MNSTCHLCSTRKAKRACPGVHQDICAVCCGTKRLTVIRCPPDCPYLASAREHPPAVVVRQQDRDMGFLLPRINDLTEMQYRLFLYLQARVLQHAKAAIPAPLDADAADAASSVAATLETAGKGIIYEHQAQSLPAQRLAAELGRAVADLAQQAGAQASRVERDAAAALRRIERVAREAGKEIADEASPATTWLALARRMMRGEGANGKDEGGAAPSPSPDAPRIVLP
jgi:hypothetical protein